MSFDLLDYSIDIHVLRLVLNFRPLYCEFQFYTTKTTIECKIFKFYEHL